MKRAASLAWRLMICSIVACGGDDEAEPSVSIGNRPPVMEDGGAEPRDAQTAPGSDAAADAALDARVPDAEARTDDDAGEESCDDESCSAMSDACSQAACNPDTRRCERTAHEDGTPCGDARTTECSAPDSCLSGVCMPNHGPAGVDCGDQGVVCHLDDSCDGEGGCVDRGFEAAGAICGSQLDSECDDPDSCDAEGRCQANPAAADSPCGSVGIECHHDDFCDGAGHCDDQGTWRVDNCPAGSVALPWGCSCGGGSAATCTPSVCSAAGACEALELEEGSSCGLGPSEQCCDAAGACAEEHCSL